MKICLYCGYQNEDTETECGGCREVLDEFYISDDDEHIYTKEEYDEMMGYF
ncbi:MAG: hypothetical protein SOZ23_05185 [Methanosphaera sp.]|uniref:hypothetical protein n=1 Tax=Methanosphaera sp. TaxID=2666342 RepID=UPI0025CC1EB6|nr:hypothetical protein [Methanosphaera sp.]MCI5867552.1 hypothetical protein [Methanosphaera sp.]MDD6534019.1 hypothetical protein [Methanosphaera sp.]MDY3956171.1 hypothetical protein [Methanosphaera sp.]